MGQYEILDYLIKKKGKKVNCLEISKAVDMEIRNITRCMKKLSQYNYVHMEVRTKSKNQFYENFFWFEDK